MTFLSTSGDLLAFASSKGFPYLCSKALRHRATRSGCLVRLDCLGICDYAATMHNSVAFIVRMRPVFTGPFWTSGRADGKEDRKVSSSICCLISKVSCFCLKVCRSSSKACCFMWKASCCSKTGCLFSEASQARSSVLNRLTRV